MNILRSNNQSRNESSRMNNFRNSMSTPDSDFIPAHQSIRRIKRRSLYPIRSKNATDLK